MSSERRKQAEARLPEELEMWARWIGDECASGMEDTHRILCAMDIRCASSRLEITEQQLDQLLEAVKDHCAEKAHGPTANMEFADKALYAIAEEIEHG